MPVASKIFSSSRAFMAGIAMASFSASAPVAAAPQAAPRIAMNLSTHMPVELAPASAAPAPVTNAAAPTLADPYGLAVDSAGNLYAANLFGAVTVYNVARKLIGSITAGTNFPAAVAVSFNGNIYVANNGANNITIYNPNYTQIGTITDATLSGPSTMYIDSNDAIWVLDANGQLHAYLDNGTPVSSQHIGGTAVGPWGPNWTVWGTANSDGTFGEELQNTGEALHYGVNAEALYYQGTYAGGVAEDSLAQQYVSDISNNRIDIWSRNGDYVIGTIATPATPYGVAVDSSHSRVYVALTTLNQIAVYSTKPPYAPIGTIQ